MTTNKNNFLINGSLLSYKLEDIPFEVKSFPNPYTVSVITSINDYKKIIEQADIVIIDKKIEEIYSLFKYKSFKIKSIEAIESNKNINTVIEIIDLFIEENISKGSNVLAIGGGIIQDLSAAACALFRRGQPFTYLPTTTLGQLDSCVGAKCALNTIKAKNIIGLFSAPRKILIPTFMVKTMPITHHRAGLAEMLRLCLTASSAALNEYYKLLEYISNPSDMDEDLYKVALQLSLSIKKSVVDFDEYEKNVRRSMNYGHTFGHSVEKLTNFKIQHGLAVLLGMHIANTYSMKKKFMSENIYKDISKSIKKTLINIDTNFDFLKEITPEDIIDQFKYDKKGDGTSVPIVLIKEPGNMLFHKFIFGSKNTLLTDSIELAINDYLIWSK